MRSRTRTAAVATVLVSAMLAGCTRASTPAADTAGAGAVRVSGTVTVFAAASLTESFTAIGKDFEDANPGTDVIFNFAASSALAMQIVQGAPVDVFASAAVSTMKTVTDAGSADGEPAIFARNQLVIAVAAGNPKGITGLADLARRGVTVALCAPQAPCGVAARKAIDAAAVTVTPVTLEPDVKAALSKVKLGEVDAALVYRTDVEAAASSVAGIEFPESDQAVTEYPVVACRGAPNRTGARAFIAFVRSARGRDVLTAAGFQVP